MSKFSRSWQLVMQSFAILRSDKQLMLFPVLSAVSCLVVTAIIATGGTLMMMPAIASAAAAGEQFHPNQSPLFLIGMFSKLFHHRVLQRGFGGCGQQPPDGRYLDISRRHRACVGA